MAVKDLQQLKEIDPDYPGNWLLEARIADRKGNAQGAALLYQEYLIRAADSFHGDTAFVRDRLDALSGGRLQNLKDVEGT